MKVVVLTGAGVSAESGIRTFRDAGGLWETHPVEVVATPEGFARDPELVHRFYSARRAQLPEVEPNAAHRALARLAGCLKERGGQLTLVTQNVDDLHERGGSRDVVHMHGELGGMLCGRCGARWAIRGDAGVGTECPECAAALPSPDPLAVPRPDIVWFGEMPYHMERIERALREAELFASIGTSGEVYPAAGFVALARASGARTVEINLEPSANAALFDEQRTGKAGTLVPEWVGELCSRVTL